MTFTYQQYIDDVLSGDIATCEVTRLAVERHVHNIDRQEDDDFPYWFDEEEAQRVIRFFSFLEYYKGEKAGESIILEPWQQFYVADLFGWKREDGKRKYRTSNLWVGRKNGKTTLAAGIGLFGLTKDGENAPQIYSFATKGDQAAICWDDAVKIGKRSKVLKDRLKYYSYSVVNPSNHGFFKYLASDSKTSDGFDPYYGIADEVHAHRDSRMMDVMKSGMGARAEPLMIEISTAGFDMEGIGKQHWDYTVDVLKGRVDNEAWHGIIYTLDKNDDWDDPETWVKANPNLGVSKYEDFLFDEFQEAKSIPSKEIDFKTKQLNKWVSSKTGFIPDEVFITCGKKPVNIEMLAARQCIPALDLGEVSDLTAFAILGLPRDSEDDYIAKVWRWLPEDTLLNRKNSETLQGFVKQGFIRPTHGNATDYDHVLADIIEIVEQGLGFEQLIFDPNKGQQIPQRLVEYGIEPVAMAQTYRNLNPGVDEMERSILAGSFNYGDDKMLEWANSNIVIAQNRDGYRKFDKREAQDKIDDMVALEMAFAWAASQEDEPEQYYDGEFVAV